MYVLVDRSLYVRVCIYIDGCKSICVYIGKPYMSYVNYRLV